MEQIPLIGDFLKFRKDLKDHAPAVDLWGAALNLPQLLGGLIFIIRPEAAVILAACLASLVIVGRLHKHNPFTRLMGLSHLPWVLIAPWLVWILLQTEPGGFYVIWLAYVAATMTISLAFDARDLYLYLFSNDKNYIKLAPKDH